MPWLPELCDAAGVPRYFADAVIGEGQVPVVRRADVPLAFLALRGDRIEHRYVRPDVQRSGMGTALIAAVEDRGARHLALAGAVP